MSRAQDILELLTLNEGKKRFSVQFNVSKSKYVITHHDGKKKHKDGSDFFDIKIFKNKAAFEKAQNELRKAGYTPDD